MVNAFSNLHLPGFVCQQEEFDNSDIEDDRSLIQTFTLKTMLLPYFHQFVILVSHTRYNSL